MRLYKAICESVHGVYVGNFRNYVRKLAMIICIDVEFESKAITVG